MKRLLIKYASEISLKGLNRRIFEDNLIKNIRLSIGREHHIIKEHGRMFIDTYSDDVIHKITKIFGVLSVSEADVEEKDIEKIGILAIKQLSDNDENIHTFKIETKRADKSFPIESTDISKKIGAIVLNSIPGIKVDIHNPEKIVRVEIRDKAYVYSKEYKGVGGMPYKSAGKGILLLSGGIDSPVAGYMMAKRGLEISSVYYHSHPYTSERAKEKVIDLAKKLAEYTGSMRLYIVPFTEIQMSIIEKCREDELTIIMRRFMMKIAERIAENEKALALATGESLGQVASQTLESIYVTDKAVNLPVFRPLIGMDKVDIMDISRQIGTYDISILPYEDCCTVFVPKHPKTKPKLHDIQSSEELLDIEGLISSAVEKVEIVEV